MKQKDIIFILGSAFFIIVVWIIFDVYHNSVSSTISEKLNIQIIPITASFDDKTIDDIKKKEKIEPLYTGNTSPIITPEPVASSGATTQNTLENSQSSSEGALLQ
jgi:hypothetical protein